jgi:organic hydroperoxide reductase OsmC/OhrA
MNAPFPHRYEVSLVWGGSDWASVTAPSGITFTGGPPPQFGGKEEWWSPEELLLASVSLCLETTFFTFARREKLTVLSYRGSAEGVLDKTASGLAFTAIRLHADLRVQPEDVERARSLLDRAKRHCIVAGSLKPPVELEGSVSAP